MPFIELSRDLYHVVIPLLTGDESAFMPCPLSILEGIIDGRVFVNDTNHPTCAAVMSDDLYGGRLIGHATDEGFNQGFITLMKNRFFPEDETAPEFRLFLSTVSTTWDEIIFRIFGYRVFRIDRTQFEFNRQAFEALAPAALSEQFRGEVRCIDEELIASDERLQTSIAGLWGDTANYLQHGFGWIAISDEGKSIACCDTAFVGGGLAEVSIAVAKSTRGSGLGLYIAQKFIQECLEKNVIPNWTCDTLNTPSYRLAEKLGFKPVRPYFMFASVYTPTFHEPARKAHPVDLRKSENADVDAHDQGGGQK